jgi:hypothetical protein
MRHIWDLPAFLMLVNRIHKQLDGAEGNVAWNAWGGPKKFYTHSIWRDRPSVNAFVRAEPHATAVRRMATWGGPDAAFAEWTDASDAVDRDETMRRLETPTFYYKKPAPA